MAAALEQEQQEFPAPLEFFTDDYIAPANQAIIEEEQRRWRLLTRFERWRLRRYVASLRRELQDAGYNQLLIERQRLTREFKAARAAYKKTTFTNDEARHHAQQRIKALIEQGRDASEQLAELKETHELYEHYAGWLIYEEQNRNDLKVEAQREKRARKQMRKESKLLEILMRDVFRKTNGCHYTHKDSDQKREQTDVPKFERVVIMPNAHYFYLSASKKTFFGWRWMLPNGVLPKRLMEDEVVQALRAATKRQVDPIWTPQNQIIFRVARLDRPDALPANVYWRDAMRFYPDTRRLDLPYCIGVKEDLKFVWYDFEHDPHVLVAGRSQSGKSNLVNGMIASLVSTHSPDELRLVLVDQKGGVEFTHWSELPHLLWEMVKTVDEVQPVLQRVNAIIRRRLALLEAAHVKKISTYNQRVDADKRLARIVVVIDEMNTFVGLGQQTEELHNLIMLISSQGRAVGVHIITATQHPEVKVIPSRIKTNMSVRLCGSMPTVGASMIVLDNPEAARIASISGRFVAARGLDVLTLQTPHILDEDIAGIVGAARKAYPDVSNDLSDQPANTPLVIWNEQRLLKAAIEWLDGHLSAKKLHEMLGEESPGERYFSKLARRLIDDAEAVGYVTLAEDGSRWVISKRGRGYYLSQLEVDTTDATDTTKNAPSKTD